MKKLEDIADKNDNSDEEIFQNMQLEPHETINDLEQTLSMVFEQVSQMENEYTKVDRIVQDYDEKSMQFICKLQRKLEHKDKIILKLEDQLAKEQKLRKWEQNVAQKRIAKLESDYDVMYERMSREIKNVQDQLQHFDEFQKRNDILYEKCNQFKERMKAKEEKHNASMKDLKKLHLEREYAYKQQVVVSLRDLSLRLKGDHPPICTAGYAQRRLKELLAQEEQQNLN